MTSLSDIKKAKAIGRELRQHRKAQCLSVQSMAQLTGFSIHQIVSMEEGNVYAFHQSLDEFMNSAKDCSKSLGVNLTSDSYAFMLTKAANTDRYDEPIQSGQNHAKH